MFIYLIVVMVNGSLEWYWTSIKGKTMSHFGQQKSCVTSSVEPLSLSLLNLRKSSNFKNKICLSIIITRHLNRHICFIYNIQLKVIEQFVLTLKRKNSLLTSFAWGRWWCFLFRSTDDWPMSKPNDLHWCVDSLNLNWSQVK